MLLWHQDLIKYKISLVALYSKPLYIILYKSIFNAFINGHMVQLGALRKFPACKL